jgi:hypothetical protein
MDCADFRGGAGFIEPFFDHCIEGLGPQGKRMKESRVWDRKARSWGGSPVDQPQYAASDHESG